MFSKGDISDIALSSEYSHALECCSDLIAHDVFKLVEEGPEELINRTSIHAAYLGPLFVSPFQQVSK